MITRQNVLRIFKLATVAVWVWAVAGAMGAPVPMAEFGLPVALTLTVVHAIEVMLLLPRLRRVDGHVALNVLCFGLFHVLSLPKRRTAGESGVGSSGA